MTASRCRLTSSPPFLPSFLPIPVLFKHDTHTNTIFLSGRAHLFITPEDMQSLLSFDFPLGSTNW
jgi:hypothetical protein